MQLSEAQKQAVETIDGQVLIIACPGSGKTTTLIHRVRHMVEKGIDPASILVMTFSKAAAEEMGKRYHDLCMDDTVIKMPSFQTIHSFCNAVIAQEYGYTKDNIIEGNQVESILADIIKDMRSNKEHLPEIRDFYDFIHKCSSEISAFVNRDADPGSYTPSCCDSDVFKKILERFRKRKRDMDVIDYDDMLYITREIFRGDPDVLEKWRKIYQYYLIDEYQDTNILQRDIIYMLAGTDENANICVVGDDDQSIYGFRGADFTIFLDFPRQYPKCKIIHMDVNYRSLPLIVCQAKQLIECNKNRFEKDIKPFREGQAHYAGMKFDSDLHEAAALIQSVTRLHSQGIPYEEMAVLYRNNNQSDTLTTLLISQKIPFHLRQKKKSVYEEWAFADVVTLHRLANGQGTMTDFMKMMNRPMRYISADGLRDIPLTETDVTNHILRGLLNKKAESWRIQNMQKAISKYFMDLRRMRGLPIGEFIRYMRQEYGYDGYLKKYAGDRNEDPSTYTEWMELYENDIAEHNIKTMEELIAYAEKMKAAFEKANAQRDDVGITLSTMHSAKGLEWKVVHIIGANEGKVPSRQMKDADGIEEERRLFYVACTRAKEYLYISWKEKDDSKSGASRFVFEYEGRKEEARAVARKKDSSFLRLRKGSKIRHNTYGNGDVIKTDKDMATVKFYANPRLICIPLTDVGNVAVLKY